MKWLALTYILIMTGAARANTVVNNDRPGLSASAAAQAKLGQLNSTNKVATDLEMAQKAREENKEDEAKAWEDKAKADADQAKAMGDAAKGCENAGQKAKDEGSPMMPPPSPAPSPSPSNDKKQAETPKAPETKTDPIPANTETAAQKVTNAQQDMLIAQIDQLKKITPSTSSTARAVRAPDPLPVSSPQVQTAEAPRLIPNAGIATAPEVPRNQVVTNAQRLMAVQPKSNSTTTRARAFVQ